MRPTSYASTKHGCVDVKKIATDRDFSTRDIRDFAIGRFCFAASFRRLRTEAVDVAFCQRLRLCFDDYNVTIVTRTALFAISCGKIYIEGQITNLRFAWKVRRDAGGGGNGTAREHCITYITSHRLTVIIAAHIYGPSRNW